MAKQKNPDQLSQGVAAMKTRRQVKPTRRAKARASADSPKKRRLDILKGKFTVGPAFFEPLPGEELERINSAADRLNAEAADAMEYQETKQ